MKTAPNGYIYIATNRGGLYRSVKKYVSVKEEPNISNAKFVNPNPASDFIYVNSDGMNGNIEIYNTLGEKVLGLSPHPNPLPEGEGVNIDVSNLPVGVYFVKIGNKFEKFVKL